MTHFGLKLFDGDRIRGNYMAKCHHIFRHLFKNLVRPLNSITILESISSNRPPFEYILVPSLSLSKWDYDPSTFYHNLSNLHLCFKLRFHPASGSMNDNHLLGWLRNLTLHCIKPQTWSHHSEHTRHHNIDTSITSSHDFFRQNVTLCHDLGPVFDPLMVFL